MSDTTQFTAQLVHRNGDSVDCTATYKPHEQRLIVTVPDGDSEAYLFVPWLDALLAAARHAWPDDRADLLRRSLVHKAGVLNVIAGDLARVGRDITDGGTTMDQARADFTRELGNLILTAARYLDDLGVPLGDAITAATHLTRLS